MQLKQFFAVLACSILLVACNDGNDMDLEEMEETEEASSFFTTPFTGEPAVDEATMRPIIATINNHPAARPQSGIAAADIIYEMLAEGDITRFLALYQTEVPEVIGPIRSARDYFIDIAAGLDAFYIAHGYSPEAKSLLDKHAVDHVNGMQYDGTLFERSSERAAPHNSYFIGSNLEDAVQKASTSLLYQKKVSYTFYEAQESVKIGTEASQIEVIYSENDAFNSLYTYNADSQSYTRQSGNERTIDALTDEPIELSNVLFFEMDHYVIDQEGRREIDLTSGGTAYLFQQGMFREVRWENADGVLKAFEEDGSEVKLAPGRTWIHIVPTNPGIAASVTYS